MQSEDGGRTGGPDSAGTQYSKCGHRSGLIEEMDKFVQGDKRDDQKSDFSGI